MPLVTMRKARITLATLWLMTALGGAASAQEDHAHMTMPASGPSVKRRAGGFDLRL